jgi:hypothetical protein
MFCQDTLTATGTTQVHNGYWYPQVSSGLFTGTGTGCENNILSEDAGHELDILISNVNTVINSTSPTILTNETTITITPGVSTTPQTHIVFTNQTLTFDASNNENAQFFITSGSYITLTNVTINLTNGAKPCNIFWVSHDAMTCTDTSVQGIIICGTDFTTTINRVSNFTYTGHIFSKGAATWTNSSGDLIIQTVNCPYNHPPVPAVPPASPASPVVCYAKGTLLQTPKGYKPVELLKAGEKIMTYGRIKNNYILEKHINTSDRVHPKMDTIRWVSHFTVDDPDINAFPICFQAHSLAPNHPFQNLLVSPNHKMLTRCGIFVSAKHLVNGTTIFQDTSFPMIQYYHVECERHSVLNANGVKAESYLDSGNLRDIFDPATQVYRKMPIFVDNLKISFGRINL